MNLFWSTRYDRAMTLFATCLKDFAEFAHSKDIENNIPPDKQFKLPYKYVFLSVLMLFKLQFQDLVDIFENISYKCSQKRGAVS